MYSALSVAKYVIMRCNQQNRPISNLKLQKILYFAQAEFLVCKNEPCFAEKIEAWDFGPVVPVVYHRYKVYGSASIPHFDKNYVSSFCENDTELLNGIIDECARYSASTLVEFTHRQTPWKESYLPYRRAPISNDSIRRFFAEA